MFMNQREKRVTNEPSEVHGWLKDLRNEDTQ